MPWGVTTKWGGPAPAAAKPRPPGRARKVGPRGAPTTPAQAAGSITSIEQQIEKLNKAYQGDITGEFGTQKADLETQLATQLQELATQQKQQQEQYDLQLGQIRSGLPELLRQAGRSAAARGQAGGVWQAGQEAVRTPQEQMIKSLQTQASQADKMAELKQDIARQHERRQIDTLARQEAKAHHEFELGDLREKQRIIRDEQAQQRADAREAKARAGPQKFLSGDAVSNIVDAARQQGLQGEELVTAVAIAMAESAGNPNAMGDRGLEDATWGPSVGYWQVRSLKKETGKGGARDASRLADPGYNAKSMYQISKGGKDWSAWTTYKNGAYLEYIDQARDVATGAAPSTKDAKGEAAAAKKEATAAAATAKKNVKSKADAVKATARLGKKWGVNLSNERAHKISGPKQAQVRGRPAYKNAVGMISQYLGEGGTPTVEGFMSWWEGDAMAKGNTSQVIKQDVKQHQMEIALAAADSGLT